MSQTVVKQYCCLCHKAIDGPMIFHGLVSGNLSDYRHVECQPASPVGPNAPQHDELIDALKEIYPVLPGGSYCQCQGEGDCVYCNAKRIITRAILNGGVKPLAGGK